MLTTREHQAVQREARARRNASARARRASPRPGPAALRLVLPGVVSWARPRQQPLRGGGRRTAYPEAYLEARGGWRVAVALAVIEAGWVKPPVAEALSVVAEVVGPGKMDLDRVVTAVLDALQWGGALVDDCRVWHLQARRRRPATDERPHVAVLLTAAAPGTAVLE